MKAEKKIQGEFEVTIEPIIVRKKETPFLGYTIVNKQICKSQVSVLRLAKYLWDWLKVAPNSFSLIDMLIDHISETTIHELIHRDGNIWHRKVFGVYGGWTPADFAYLTSQMGHPSAQKIIELAKRRYAKFHTHRVCGATKRMKMGLIVIDLDEDDV